MYVCVCVCVCVSECMRSNIIYDTCIHVYRCYIHVHNVRVQCVNINVINVPGMHLLSKPKLNTCMVSLPVSLGVNKNFIFISFQTRHRQTMAAAAPWDFLAPHGILQIMAAEKNQPHHRGARAS